MQRLVKNKDGALPSEFFVAHDLCFAIHDILVEFLKSGEASGIFTTHITFTDKADAVAFKENNDIFHWLEATGRLDDRALVLKTVVLPAVLSDMLHSFYEALECSRKGKLNITYALIRKPIQESLYLLESIVLDEIGFADKLATEPLTLRPRMAGGMNGHSKRIQTVLERIQQTDAFDAEYLAQLRYEKTEDGFDGVCNKAIHLFTEHKAIRTELMNINFVFSGFDAKLTQWRYLYGRLPYILIYAWRVIEYIGASLRPTHPDYTLDMNRRIAAFVTLSAKNTAHITLPLQQFYDIYRTWLWNHCYEHGYATPCEDDMKRMALTGAFPGEDKKNVQKRLATFELRAALSRAAAGSGSKRLVTQSN
ncbi:MAG: hypothetical protein RBR56_03170 [Halothiobacillus sp.]|jgi:hypothetical protein|nr:hypothetical protein [Halothiobacillus sp.]